MGVGAGSNPGLNSPGCYKARRNSRIPEVRQCHGSFRQRTPNANAWNRWCGVVLSLRGLHWHFLQLKLSHWLSWFPCPPPMKEFGWEWASAVSIFGSADSIQGLRESLLQLQWKSWPGSTKEASRGLASKGVQQGSREAGDRGLWLAFTKWPWKPKEGNCTRIQLRVDLFS